VLFGRQDLGSAADAFRRALSLTPEDTKIRHHLSMVLLARGERGEAGRELERILLIDPGNVAASLDLGVHALSSQRMDEAMMRFDVALRCEPRNPRARYYRGLTLQLLGRAEEAVSVLEPLAAETTSKYGQWARERIERGIDEHPSGQAQ
jgi:Flp pilus assembly protein TadD